MERATSQSSWERMIPRNQMCFHHSSTSSSFEPRHLPLRFQLRPIERAPRLPFLSQPSIFCQLRLALMYQGHGQRPIK